MEDGKRFSFFARCGRMLIERNKIAAFFRRSIWITEY